MVPELYLVEFSFRIQGRGSGILISLTFDFRPPHISCPLVSRTLFRILPFCGCTVQYLGTCDLSQSLNLPPIIRISPHTFAMCLSPHLSSPEASTCCSSHMISGYKETLLSAKRLGPLFSPIVCFVPCILPITNLQIERIQAPWGQNSLSIEFEEAGA
jgi:hypothetical protein